MFKRMFICLILLTMLTSFVGCGYADVEHSSGEENTSFVSEAFYSDPFFAGKEGDYLSDEEIRAIISDIPSDKYESYPDTHSVPLSAILYKGGESISLDRNDPRLIRIINFFHNCVYYAKCAYTQGLLPVDYLEKSVLHSDFRLELKYMPCSDTAPSPYGKCTTGCDTITITNSSAGFTLIAHDIPGYEGQEERYPYCAVGFYPLYDNYSWLELFGF